jgi:arabinofuranan 3-O-arabinosyltransferase
VHENASPGWHATLNGKPLTAATLDGWQQAFVVPAGQGGTIRLSFAPAAIYHAGIVVSAVALLALLAVGFGRRRGWLWRRRKDSGQRAGLAEASTPLRELPAPAPLPAPAGQPGGAAWTAALSAAAGGPAPGSGAHRARHARSRPEPPPAQRRRLSSSRLVRVIVMLLPVAAVIALAGGPLVLVVPVLAVLAALRPGWLPAVALTAMLAAGVFAATATNPTALGSGTFSAPAQACALIALTAALLPVLRQRPA